MPIEAAAAARPGTRRGRGRYRALVWRRQLILAGVGLALIARLCVDLAFGPARYSRLEAVRALVSPGAVPQQVRVVL